MIDLKKAKKTISLQNEELENQREQLKALNASKDKFFSIIAHDLRNPIAGFLNLTEILSSNFEVFSESESKKFIDVMNQASIQLYNLLENLLQWSKAQTNSITHEPKLISVKNMIENTIETLMVNIKNKNLKINLNVDEKLIAFVDENMITTVIRNLISNAIKFSHPNEKITIRCIQKDNLIEISVIDNGVGIKKEDHEKLFRIDQNVTTLGTSKERGTGLGLILCKEFVEKNNGNIRMESDLNKGSAFIFTIPLKDKK
jgi:signal transduction histidine kinase